MQQGLLGLILINHGSPVSPSEPDVARYLLRFLSDKRVIDMPWPLRQFLVRAIIVPRRKAYSAANYQKIWDAERKEFPLVTDTKLLGARLEERLGLPVGVAMRYGNPTVEDAYMYLKERGAKRFLFVPLYPQYAMSSYETAVRWASKESERLGFANASSFLPPFYDHPAYIRALAEEIRPVLLKQRPQRLLLSFHGIPVSHQEKMLKANPGKEKDVDYFWHCQRTTMLLAEALEVDLPIEMVFQSRLGRAPWLSPYLSERIKKLPQEGCRRLVVASPGFIVDCLETTHELADEEKSSFITAGGESFTYIPALGYRAPWVRSLAEIIKEQDASKSGRKL